MTDGSGGIEKERLLAWVKSATTEELRQVLAETEKQYHGLGLDAGNFDPIPPHVEPADAPHHTGQIIGWVRMVEKPNAQQRANRDSRRFMVYQMEMLGELHRSIQEQLKESDAA